MKKQWNILILLIIVLLIVLFAIQNASNITVNYLFGSVRIPRVLLIIISILIGALLAGLASFFRLRQLKRQNRRLAKELRRVSELHPDDIDRMSAESETAADGEAGTRIGRRALRKKQH
ncbi:MAG: lipopolysaccharide assembly protein LapA domain-containing protein [Sporolactobacillus sp.]|jgi:uncharacterized integral membrane protein|nr:lipopolysaccharide assembly protein LapA domain-containing protein [Sporolactobacillus sp.]MCI1881206.1 lipopolysaccharide assembly protein LapA domain-containing protein [Sporolactobacillus sp.]